VLTGKNGEFPHRVDRKAAVPVLLVEGTMLEESLDVFPTKRLIGKKPPLLLGIKVVPKARYKQIFLVPELGIQP
jgi:hypothetical protein